MARDAGPVLHDILETIALIETALAGKSREDFGKDDILRLAIQRAIEIISEASRHIPDDLLSHAPQIPWRSIRGIGNVLRAGAAHRRRKPSQPHRIDTAARTSSEKHR